MDRSESILMYKIYHTILQTFNDFFMNKVSITIDSVDSR